MTNGELSKHLSALRSQFEEDLTAIHALRKDGAPDLKRHEDAKGGSLHAYKNKKTQQLWLGYKLHHEMRYAARWVNPRDVERPLGKYVVAKINHIGVPSFSHHPFRHHLRKDAVAEANRLGVEYGGRFAVFRCIEVAGQPPLIPVGEQLKSLEMLAKENPDV